MFMLDSFLQVLLCERNGYFELRCYMMPNEPVNPDLPLKNFMIPIEFIERASGMLIFEKIRNVVRWIILYMHLIYTGLRHYLEKRLFDNWCEKMIYS